MRERFACEIQNQEKFCSLNPESWALESWNTAQGIRNLTKRLESRIRVPLTKTGVQYVESESMVWNPGSKTVLDSLKWSYFSFALMNLRHNNTSMTKRWKVSIKNIHVLWSRKEWLIHFFLLRMQDSLSPQEQLNRRKIK